MSELGKSIVIEGNDGTGKSTQVEMLGEKLQQDYGIDSLTIHEPDGPGIAGEIRKLIKNGELERDPVTNLLLFTASRHETNLLGKQAIKAGKWLLKARDWSSTEAYQGQGEGVDPEFIEKITRMFTDGSYMAPDLKVILAVTDDVRAERIANRGDLEQPDTFEKRGSDFQTRVNQAYIEIAKRDNLPIIDASQSIQEIHEAIMNEIVKRGLLPRR